MKTLFILLDTLVRNSLECYNQFSPYISTANKTKIPTPNISRLAQKSICFDNHYVGSLPCMPARRDMMTGRLNFMHSSWGCLEPYDNSFARILRNETNVHSHLITDHPHYFANGGFGYHTCFDVWDFKRGQEGDSQYSYLHVSPSEFKNKYHPKYYPTEDGSRRLNSRTSHILNRECLMNDDESQYPLVQCIEAAKKFLDTNHDQKDWLLQLECFDPHEPYTAMKKYREKLDIAEEIVIDWPQYDRRTEDDETRDTISKNYMALVMMIDDYLGEIFDKLDEYNLWDDTCVILTTDHGILLGEHEWWGKNRQAYYQEIAHIPLIFYHPDYKDQAGTRRQSITTTIDLMPTLLELNGAEIPEEVTGQSILPLLKQESGEKRTVIYGMFGGAISICDTEYTYFLYPNHMDSADDLFEYTLMPENIHRPMSLESLRHMELVEPFDFTKDIQLLKISADKRYSLRIPYDRFDDTAGFGENKTRLFNIKNDPQQLTEIHEKETEYRLKQQITQHLIKHDAPKECYTRFGLSAFVKQGE
ncbi:MAG: sulfatase [Niabella sp.]